MAFSKNAGLSPVKPGFRVSEKALKPGFSGSGKPGLETLLYIDRFYKQTDKAKVNMEKSRWIIAPIKMSKFKQVF